MLKIDAQALHDYTARSDKELSFKRGDLLQVIEKTPDNNWWDGFSQGRRGFIPVAYIEIVELNQASEQPAVAPPSAINVPPPPLRRSSMPPTNEGAAPSKTTEAPSEEAIVEENLLDNLSPKETHPPTDDSREAGVSTPELKVEMVVDASGQETASEVAGGSETPEASTEKEEPAKPLTEPTKKVRSGAVKSLTQQYDQPPPSQRVLVEPHHTHKRQQSDTIKKPTEGGEKEHRTFSGGSKVGMLSSAFESKAAAAPPPLKPKPPVSIPSSPITEQQQHAAMAFPLMSHSYPSVSPLQRASFISQSGKPAPPAQPQGQKKPSNKGSISRAPKRDRSFKSPDKSGGKPSLPAKPPAPAKPSYVPPPGMGGLHSKDLKEEMQARLKKQQDK